jgi:nucleoside-diphosphate-sugar epimerase
MTDNNAVHSIAITGATGFIGKHLLLKLDKRPGITIRALTRRQPDQLFSLPSKALCWIVGDLADSLIATDLLVPGGTLINLAFPEPWTRNAHVESTGRLATAAAKYGVRRVIHCSTAVVVGTTRQRRVTEETESSPQTEYEKTKLAIEQIWRTNAEGRFDLAIVRPSAVFGPGGKNLVTLADALKHGSRSINYLRSTLFSRRKMNLVRVQSVVAAIELLMDRSDPFNGGVFNISSDDDPLNNFRDVERILMRELGVDDYALLPPLAPRFFLSTLLRLTGRSNTNPDRVYDCTSLQRLGWQSYGDIEQGLRDFAAWYLSHRRIA